MPKGIGEYKVLDKLKTSLAAIIMNYRECKKFGFSSLVLDLLSADYEKIDKRLDEIDL